VVGVAAGGLSEVVADGETGLLVPPKDVEALRAAIAKLIEDPALRRELGDTGRLRMQNDFSIEAMVDDHVQLYESILNVKP
jgi:glycosyltransferase involved in cell wall biosynthesis